MNDAHFNHYTFIVHLWRCANLRHITVLINNTPVVGYTPETCYTHYKLRFVSFLINENDDDDDEYLRFLLLNARGGLLFSDVVRSFICDTHNGVCISETENKRVV